MIFPCAGGIGWLDAAGKVMAWRSGGKEAAVVLELPFPVEDAPFSQGGFLVLKKPGADRLLVVDLAGPRVAADLEGLAADKLLGIDRDCLVYSGDGRLQVKFWRQPGSVFRERTAEEKFFNCYFSAERILVLTRERLHTFWKESGKFESAPLPQLAASPFYHDGEHAYFGSVDRYLLKYSTRENRLVWKLKLGQVLEKQPMAFAGSIVAGTADHNFLQLNGRGSILWWQALGSTMNFDLMPMSDHLAAFLLNGEVKFIDPRRRQVTEFQGHGHPLGQPLVFAHDVYFMLREGASFMLQRIGNRYGIDIELEPAPVRWLGRSLRFFLQPRNLLAPAWDCVIRDAAGEQVFSKSMSTTERVSLVWLPLQPGKYRIRVQARALNRNEESEISVHILDPQRPLPGIYLHF
jgi:hypothetical protein